MYIMMMILCAESWYINCNAFDTLPALGGSLQSMMIIRIQDGQQTWHGHRRCRSCSRMRLWRIRRLSSLCHRSQPQGTGCLA